MTFQAYLRALRVGQAFGRIKDGEAGHTYRFRFGLRFAKRLCGFVQEDRRIFSKQEPERTLIATTRILTHWDQCWPGRRGRHLPAGIHDRRMLETQIKHLNRLFQTEWYRFQPATSTTWNQQLEEYFQRRTQGVRPCRWYSGERTFKRGVAGVCSRSHTGDDALVTRARPAGWPAECGAVAHANGDNRIAIIVPCTGDRH